jgi:hypothetical protein
VKAIGTAAPQVLITSPDPYKLAALVQRERARRSIVVVQEQAMVAPGVWGVGVYQLRPLHRPWVAPACLAAGTLGAGALLWWVVSMLLAALPLLLGVSVVLLLALRGGTSVDVHVRVRT